MTTCLLHNNALRLSRFPTCLGSTKQQGTQPVPGTLTYNNGITTKRMAADNIFEDCVFSVVQSGEFGKSYVSQVCHSAQDRMRVSNDVIQIKESISTGGGECRELDSNGIIDLKHVTHIISVTSDFPQYMSALEQRISVVTPGWVTHSLLKNRQAPIRQFTPDPNLFYSNVVLSCGDIPSGDKNAIIGAVLALGGMESNSLTKMVTHICALSMDHEKCQQALEKDLKAKIVLPHWYVRTGSMKIRRLFSCVYSESFRLIQQSSFHTSA